MEATATENGSVEDFTNLRSHRLEVKLKAISTLLTLTFRVSFFSRQVKYAMVSKKDDETMSKIR